MPSPPPLFPSSVSGCSGAGRAAALPPLSSLQSTPGIPFQSLGVISLPFNVWKSAPGPMAGRALALRQVLPAGAEGCSRPCVPQQVCRDILILLLVELHLLLVFRAPHHFHDRILGYIYPSYHQSWSLKFLSGKHLSCAVKELSDLGTSLILTSCSAKGGEIVTGPPHFLTLTASAL